MRNFQNNDYLFEDACISQEISKISEQNDCIYEEDVLSEAVAFGIAGLEYEQEVYDSIKKASRQSPNIKMLSKKATGNFTRHDVDIKFQSHDEIFNLEVKLNTRARLGGVVFHHKIGTNEFISTHEMNPTDEKIIITALQKKKKELFKLADFLRSQPPKKRNEKITRFPANVTHKAWLKAQKKGLVKACRQVIEMKLKMVEKFYNDQEVYYIQIGGKGLYYLKSNPFELPIPRFAGKINVEIDVGSGGGRNQVINNREYRIITANIRPQGRTILLSSKASPYTLDNPKDVIELLG